MSKDAAATLEQSLHDKLPLVKAINCHIEEARPGYVKASMEKSHLITNHFGAFHAGAIYTFAETVGGGVITISLDVVNNLLIAKEGVIKYLKTVTERAHSEAYFDQAEIDKINKELEDRGKSEFIYKVTILNQDNEVACEVDFTFYLRKKKA